MWGKNITIAVGRHEIYALCFFCIEANRTVLHLNLMLEKLFSESSSLLNRVCVCVCVCVRVRVCACVHACVCARVWWSSYMQHGIRKLVASDASD
jgi:hypothetical protein